jgi:hypothetical protein
MVFQPEAFIQFQDRDLALLRDLFECRIMTSQHVAAINFNGKWAYAKKRIQKLKAAGFIGERARRMNEPSILFLTRKAFILLRDEGILSAYPPLPLDSLEARGNVSDLTLRHELAVMDVKTQFHATLAKSSKFRLAGFTTWPMLNQFESPGGDHGSNVTIRPDGFIRIEKTEAGAATFAHHCFLELDRSTEKLDLLVNRAASYLEYYKSGGFAAKNGADSSDYRRYPFRVIMVFKTAERRNNTAERLLQCNPPILSLAWLTTFAEVTTDPLGAIWIQPRQYREATMDTRFDTEQRTTTFVYRHNPEREAFIESKIQKLRLLES